MFAHQPVLPKVEETHTGLLIRAAEDHAKGCLPAVGWGWQGLSQGKQKNYGIQTWHFNDLYSYW